MLKIFSAPANVQGGIRVKQATADMFGGGSGMIEAGKAITELGEERGRQEAVAAREKEVADNRLLRSQVAAEKSTAAVNIAEAREQWTNKINEQAASGEPVAGMRERNMAEFEAYAEEAISGFRTPEGKAAARVGLARLRATLSIQASTHEAAARARQIKDDFTAGNAATANVLMRNPEMLDGEGAELGDFGLMKERVDAVNDLPVSAELKRTLAAETRRVLTVAAVAGHIRKSPEKTLSDLSDGKYDAILHPKTVLSLMTDATVKMADDDKEEAHRVSMEVADLLVRTSRGQATQEDIDQYIAANKPYMNRSQITALNYKLDTTERRVARGILDPNKGWDAAEISVKITEATDLETLAGLGASVAEMRATFKPAAWARLRKDLHAKKMKILGADQKVVDAKAKLAEGWDVAHLRNAAKRARTVEDVVALEQALGERDDIKPRDWESIQNVLDRKTFKFIEAEREASAKEGKRLNDVGIVRLTQTINNASLDDIPQLRAHVENLVDHQGLEANHYKVLVAALDSRSVEARTQRDRTLLVMGALNGQTNLDPNTPAHRKAVDAAYGPMQQQWEDEKLTPETVADNTVAFVVKVGIIPSSVKTAVQGGLNSPAPEVVAYSAQLVDQMHRQKPSLVSQFSADEVALASQISRTIEAGATTPEAVEHVRALRKVSEADRTARGKEFDVVAEKSITGHSLVRTAVAELITDDAFGASGFLSPDPTSSRALESEAARIMREEYQKVGDMNLAKAAVGARLPRAWATTAIDGTPRVMRDAPELHYSAHHLSHSENSEWMREQLIEDMTSIASADPSALSTPFGGVAPKLALIPEPDAAFGEGRFGDTAAGMREMVDNIVSSRTRLVIDRSRTRAGALPVYQLLILPVDGNAAFPLRKDGTPVLWAPDYSTSRRKAQDDAEQAQEKSAFGGRRRALTRIRGGARVGEGL